MTLRRLYLVRHGRSEMDRRRPPHTWGLDPAGLADVDALRASGRLPAEARWFSSPEAKALDTARRLTDRPVAVVPELREHERHTTHWFDDPADFRATVRRAFDEPDRPALDGWETLATARDRVVSAVRRILADHPSDDVVLAGHGTAWTALVAELTGQAPASRRGSGYACRTCGSWTSRPPRRARRALLGDHGGSPAGATPVTPHALKPPAPGGGG